uniref:SET binding protein 1 n=1 Tax=Poecilia formosa TaxID=48698 RepID=A0A087YHI2_POEFO
GEGLMEEQEFSIKEASFQEGSLKLKIQTTKRTKKPPKSLENYICPPEIRMTIRPPVEVKYSLCGVREAVCQKGRGSESRKVRSDPGSTAASLLRTWRRLMQPRARRHTVCRFDAFTWQKLPKEHLLLFCSQNHVERSPGHDWGMVDLNVFVCIEGGESSTVASRHLHSVLRLASFFASIMGKSGHKINTVPQLLFSTLLLFPSFFPLSVTPPPAPPASSYPVFKCCGYKALLACRGGGWRFPQEENETAGAQKASTRRDQVLQTDRESLLWLKNIKRKYGRKDSQRMFANPQSADAPWGRQSERESESPANSEERQRYRQEGTAEQFQEAREERRKDERDQANIGRRGDEEERGMPVQAEDGKQTLDTPEKPPVGPPEPKIAHKIEAHKNDSRLSSQRDSSADRVEKAEKADRVKKNPVGRPKSLTDSLKLREATYNQINVNERWSYLKAKNHTSLTSPQRDSMGSPSALSDPPSAFPITPSSPLYTNTDSLTVHAPIKRKRGRPKKQPLLTVETIHEGTSTSPPSPLAKESNLGISRRRKMHTLNPLVHAASSSPSDGFNSLKVKRGRGHPRAVIKTKLGKMQSILNEILSGSSQNGSLALKSASAPVTSAMSAMATTIEARLGKQINVSKRGTIYIGKKRGRKPRAETQGSVTLKASRDKPQMSLSMSSFYDSPAVPSTNSSPSSCAPSLRASNTDATMPSLQPISALPAKPSGRGFLSGGWKLSPPRLLANSPSHLSEGASVKEVTLSPISESHSEETIPSDSGIGTDNNSTSDQTEKGPASRRRYSFDLCGFESPEAAALDTSTRGSRPRCERKVTAVDSYLSQQEKKQKHHRRKRKCLQTRDHLHFLSELEEVVLKFQQLRVSHRLYTCYPQHPYPSIFRLNFHHYYPLSYDSYACDSGSYLRRSADLKAKRRRGRPAKASEPITSKLPFVPGYGYALGGGNYYAAPYAMPYAPPLNLGYFPPTPPFYLPHHSLGPAPPSPFMRPAVPPPKAFLSSGHPKLQVGAKIRSASGPLQGPTVRSEALGSLSGSSAGGLAGVRLHKRKHKHKHKHKDEPLLSPRDRQELGGLFSGAKTNVRLGMLSERRDLAGQGSSKHLEKQRGNARGPNLGSGLGIFESDQLSGHALADGQFHSRQTAQPAKGFMSGYGSQSQRSEAASDLFSGLREDECAGRSRRTRLAVFGDQGLMSFQTARQEPEQMNERSSPALTGEHTKCPPLGDESQNAAEPETIIRTQKSHLQISPVLPFLQLLPLLSSSTLLPQLSHPRVPGKRRYKRREVEQIQKDVRRMHSLNFDHVQKILRAKRLQRQAKTGNNVIKRRPGRPRKQPLEESQPATMRMPVLERCDNLPGRHSLRPSLALESHELPAHDSIAATIETVVHQARCVPP